MTATRRLGGGRADEGASPEADGGGDSLLAVAVPRCSLRKRTSLTFLLPTHPATPLLPSLLTATPIQALLANALLPPCWR